MSDDGSVSKCLRNLLAHVGDVEYGYRIQGLAAHVLMRTGATVTSINNCGHPDISAVSYMGEDIRVEIEADLGSLRDREPTLPDLYAISPRTQTDLGYFAYLMTGFRVKWLVVRYEALATRHGPIPNATIAALSDPVLSARWTEAMKEIVSAHCEKLWLYSYSSLCKRALSGRGL